MTFWIILWQMFSQFCENIDIAFVDNTAKVTVVDVIVICIADVNAVRCMNCYSARWLIFLHYFLWYMVEQHISCRYVG